MNTKQRQTGISLRAARPRETEDRPRTSDLGLRIRTPKSKVRSPKSVPISSWTIREWGSFSSVIGTVVLLWLTFGPRRKQLGGGQG